MKTKRVLLLEEILIPMLERQKQEIHPANCNYQHILIRLDELKLEYKERTGKSYDEQTL